MRKLAWGVMVLAALAMAACGGSSSSSSGPKFSGNTSKATIVGGEDGNVDILLELVGESLRAVVMGEYDIIFDDIPLFRTAEDATQEMTYEFDGDCGGTLKMVQTVTTDSLTFERFTYTITANKYCNVEGGPATEGAVWNGKISVEEEDWCSKTECGEDFEAVAKNWTMMWDNDPEDPDDDEMTRMDGKVTETSSEPSMARTVGAFVPADNPAEKAVINMFFEETMSGETYGAKVNLTSVLSYEEVPPAPAASMEPEGYEVNGTVCDYVEGCLTISTEQLLDYSYYCDEGIDCQDYIDWGQIIADGAGSDSMRVTFDELNPQYEVQLWDGETWGASMWFDHDYVED